MTSTSPEPRRRKLRLQFSLRTLLVAVLVLSLPLSWFAVKMERARKQREAVEAIQGRSGIVQYDYERNTFERTPSERSVPAWLRELLGNDFFFDVEEVYAKHFGDEEMTYLNKLTDLEILSLNETQVTPEGVKKLQEALPDCTIVY